MIYDVYNNGRDLGGKLQVIFDKCLAIMKNHTIYLTKSNIYPKIVNRKFLNDITFRIGIHVCNQFCKFQMVHFFKIIFVGH